MRRSSATSTSTDRPLLLGHRGARSYAPENSLAAFDLALEHGCDGFEFDVRRSRDGYAVVCHDPKLRGHAIGTSSLQELLAIARDLPLLDQVLERFAGRAFLDIELKVAGLEDATADALAKHPAKKGVVVSSFLPEVIAAFRRRAPEVPVGFITDKREHLPAWLRIEPEYVIPRFTLVGPRLVDEVHAAGKKLLTWTVNDERMMRRMAEVGVDGIISDDTQRLSRALSGFRHVEG